MKISINTTEVLACVNAINRLDVVFKDIDPAAKSIMSEVFGKYQALADGSAELALDSSVLLALTETIAVLYERFAPVIKALESAIKSDEATGRKHFEHAIKDVWKDVDIYPAINGVKVPSTKRGHYSSAIDITDKFFISDNIANKRLVTNVDLLISGPEVEVTSVVNSIQYPVVTPVQEIRIENIDGTYHAIFEYEGIREREFALDGFQMADVFGVEMAICLDGDNLIKFVITNFYSVDQQENVMTIINRIAGADQRPGINETRLCFPVTLAT